jgi:predicted metal-dependent phosphoesterase TrpH
MKVRTDFHIHAAGDPYDHVHHTVRDIIDTAEHKKINCIAITNHMAVTYNDADAAYAKEKGILLLPGSEIRIHNRDVLIINADEDAVSLNTLDDLRTYRAPHRLIIAPHPFYPITYALGNYLRENFDVFDAVEVSGCYHKWHNHYNNDAVTFAKNHNLPTLGNSDTHHLWQFGKCFSEIECENLTCESIFSAIREKKTTHYCSPLSLWRIVKFALVGTLYRRIRRNLKNVPKN